MFAAGAVMVLATSMAWAASPTARALLHTAEAQAQSSHRNVLVIFGASWCGWCHELDAFMKTSAVAPVLAKSFTVVHLDIEEHGARASQNTPGALALARHFRGSESLPFLVMLRPDGKLIATSNRTGGPNSNVGYPVKPDEVAWFIEMVHRGAPGLTAAERKALRHQLTSFNRQHKLQ
ncbi:MAG: thioredoxin family protein [Terriglobales bacterium]